MEPGAQAAEGESIMGVAYKSRRGTPLAAVLGAAVALSACQGSPKPPHAASGPLIQAPAACSDVSFRIYFEPGSAALTRGAEDLIAAAERQSRACAVTGIVVVGLADAPGTPAANLELSRRRADAVTAAMHRHGFDAIRFEVTAEGAAGAAGEPGHARPLRRRVDVTIHLSSNPPAR